MFIIKKLSNIRKIFLCIAFLVGGVFLNLIASEFIQFYYPNRPIVQDLIFDITPTVLSLQYFSDPLILIALMIFGYLLLQKFTYKYLYQVLISLNLVYYARALIIPLTPFKRPFIGSENYGILNLSQHGMFPSGHSALMFLLFLLVPKKNKVIKSAIFVLFILQIIVLSLSRGHYSIDIVGGIMLAYISYDLTKKYFIK